MPAVTYDGRSFLIGGRRVWIVSGSIHYARVPRALWAERIRAAQHAGLNTIETSVFWNRHEPRPGQFDFAGENDLRAFVDLIGAAGMYCILRVGPFTGAEWDFGGLPAWLSALGPTELRAGSGRFLEAASRFMTAVAERVRDRQVTSARGGGPVLLVQTESAWTCGDEAAADAYLRELVRYVREAGITVPTINSNNLWQGVEGQIDGWRGGGNLLPVLRQLARVRPDQPRVVIEMAAGRPTTWGEEVSGAPAPGELQRQLAQVLAAGAQYNLDPFCGGTNFEFWGARRPFTTGEFYTTSRDAGAPLRECGLPGATYQAVRRLSMFASRFGRVLAHLDPAYQPVVLGADDASSRPVVAHAVGAQGGVAFVMGSTADAGQTLPLVLPDGRALGVPMPSTGVAWVLFDVALSNRARLDHSSLSALAHFGRVLVCFGPPGTRGELSINGSPLEVVVPTGKMPLVQEHEGITVVVCSEEQTDQCAVTDSALLFPCDGLDESGELRLSAGARQTLRVGADGTASTSRASGATPVSVRPPALGDWSMAPMTEHAAGESPRYAAIDGPADLAALGSPYGLGWYRLRFKSASTRRARLFAPRAADRLHYFLDGKGSGVVGAGPGASEDVSVSLKKGPHTLVVLAENLGRVCGGAYLGESKGLWGHVYEAKPLRVAKPELAEGERLDPLRFRSPLWEVHRGDLVRAERIAWTVQHRRKTPVFMCFGQFVARGLVLLNGTPIHWIGRGGVDRLLFDPEYLARGNNTIEVAPMPTVDASGVEIDPPAMLERFASAVTFVEGAASVSEGAEWAFAKWEAPDEGAYRPVAKSALASTAKELGDCPTWWRTSFRLPPTQDPVFFDATGLTKGQLYVNGRHLGRYFVATGKGKAVPPQRLYYIPGPWLSGEKDNEILLFDEHGAHPGRCRLVVGE